MTKESNPRVCLSLQATKHPTEFSTVPVWGPGSSQAESDEEPGTPAGVAWFWVPSQRDDFLNVRSRPTAAICV